MAIVNRLRILVIGATGMAGSAISNEALARGHSVIGASRSRPESHRLESMTHHVLLDAREPSTIVGALKGIDVIVLAGRPTSGNEMDIVPMTHNVLQAAASLQLRVVVVGGAGALKVPGDPESRLVENDEFVPLEWKSVARASLAQLAVCYSFPDGNWVYLSPSAQFEPGQGSDAVVRGGDELLVSSSGVSRITSADLAIVACDEIDKPTGLRHVTAMSDAPA